MSKNRFVAIFGLALVLGLVLGLTISGIARPAKAEGSTVCRTMVDPTVQTGPNAGTKLDGELKLTIDSNGIADGTFATKDGKSSYKVSGAFVGRSINFSVDLGDGKYLYAMGNTVSDIKDNCGTNWGGVFEGLGGMGIWPETYIQKPGH